MLEFEPGLSREKALVIFIQKFRDGNDKCAAKHLQAYTKPVLVREYFNNVLGHEIDPLCTRIWYYLYKIADKTARNFYY
ncbi:MAG: hypothetical protein MGG11_19960 [Trichodesmium sp. MAG_R03]|nr:hypothetical protein [Trichodesmium sp. MAG_R03]